MIDRRPITDEDRRRAVQAAVSQRIELGRFVRITPGIRRAIIHSAEYRSGHRSKP